MSVLIADGVFSLGFPKAFHVSLPGNLSAKDKEKGVQVSPEKKVRRAKLVGYMSSEVSIVSCLLRFWNYGRICF